MLSPFLLKAYPARRASLVALHLSAAAVVAASLAAGLGSLASDLRLAYAYAGPSVFTDIDRRQMEEVRDAIAPGDTLLLVAAPADVWHARLWQRGLYPRNPVVVLLGPYDAATIRRLRERHAVRSAVVIGEVPGIAGFRRTRDLGHLPGSPSPVRFGELSP